MPWWKQTLLCLGVLIAAAGVWYSFFPGAREIAAEWGIVEMPAEAATSAQDDEGGGRGGLFSRLQSPVVTAPVNNATINDRLSAIGTGKALRTVSVRPLSAGRLVEVLVESGGEVEAGEVIARMDSDAERIAVDRAEIALKDARAQLERIEALRSSNTVTAVQHAEAELAVQNAELELREATLALERREITAPIGGTVGILPVSTGDYVTSSDDIAVIDDRSQILVDFWVPERFAGQLEIGMPLTAESISRRDETYEGAVSAIDNQIDPESRTLRVQGRIANPSEALRSGMAFRITMQFPGDSFPAIDPLAIQWGTDGPYVWVVREGTAQRTPVRVVQRNSDSVLIDASFTDGDRVVIEGVHAVEDGQPVAVAENEAEPSARGS